MTFILVSASNATWLLFRKYMHLLKNNEIHCNCEHVVYAYYRGVPNQASARRHSMDWGWCHLVRSEQALWFFHRRKSSFDQGSVNYVIKHVMSSYTTSEQDKPWFAPRRDKCTTSTSGHILALKRNPTATLRASSLNLMPQEVIGRVWSQSPAWWEWDITALHLAWACISVRGPYRS